MARIDGESGRSCVKTNVDGFGLKLFEQNFRPIERLFLTQDYGICPLEQERSLEQLRPVTLTFEKSILNYFNRRF